MFMFSRKSKITLIVGCFISLTCLAGGGGVVDGGGLGDMSQYALCGNTQISFSVSGTAIPTYFSGSLWNIESDQPLGQFGCLRGEASSEVAWYCTDRTNDDRIVQITRKELEPGEAKLIERSTLEPEVLDVMECSKLD
jgi:hypothetical protein